MTEYCVCGHPKEMHSADVKDSLCALCIEMASYDVHIGELGKAFHPFKLDNLRYIEDVAKERKLI